MSRWYYTPDNRQRLGPVTSEELRALAVSGTIRPECMVMPEEGAKWVAAATVKGLFPKPAPAASPPVAQVLVPCPKCGREIPLQVHELSWTIECAQCGATFIPSQAAAQSPPPSPLLNDHAPPVKGDELAGNAGIPAPRGSRIPLPAMLAGAAVLCLVGGISTIVLVRSGNRSSGDASATNDRGARHGTTAAEPELVNSDGYYDRYRNDEATADKMYLNKRLQFQVQTGWSGVEKDRDGKYFAWVSMDCDENHHLILYFRNADAASRFRASKGLIRGTCSGLIGRVEASPGYSYDPITHRQIGRPISRGRWPVLLFKDCELVE
jgi:hypothetical protein